MIFKRKILIKTIKALYSYIIQNIKTLVYLKFYKNKIKFNNYFKESHKIII